MDKLKYSDFFDFSDDKPIKEIISNLEKMENVYDKLIGTVKSESGKISSAWDDLKKKADGLAKEVGQLNETQEDGQKSLGELAKATNQMIITNGKYKKSLEDNEKELQGYNNGLGLVKKAQDDLKKSTDNTSGSLTELKKQLREAEKAYSALGDSVDDAIKQEHLNNISELSKRVNASSKALKEAKKAADFAAGSYNELNDFVLKGRKRLKDMEGSLEGNSEEFKQLQTEVAEAIVKLKEWDQSIGDNFRNVGNYKESVKEAVAEIDLFGKVNEQTGGILGIVSKTYAILTKQTEAQAAAQEGANKSTTRGAKAFRVLGKALKATGIVAIIAAIASLVGYFTKTISGGTQLAKIMNRVTAVFNVLVGSLASAGKALVSFFNNLRSGEWDAAKQDLQGVTGAFDNFGERVSSQIKQMDELTQATAYYRKSVRELEIAIAQLTTAEELSQAASDAATLSFKQREEAALRTAKAGEELRMAQIKLAQEELRIANMRLKIAQDEGLATNELLDEQKDAQVQLIEAEKELTLFLFEQEELRRQLKQDRLEKDLDILIDGFDNQKTINERIVADERTSQRKRQELFLETQKLSDIAFQKQIETIQKFTNESINANDLLATSDAQVLNEKIRALGLSEIIEGRLLEVIRERRTVTQDLADIEKDINDRAIAMLGELVNNERALIDERIAARQELGDLEIQVQEESLAKGLINEQEFADRVRKINEDLTNDILKLQEQRATTEFSIGAAQLDTGEFEELIALNEQFQSGQIKNLESFERQKNDIQKSNQILRLQQEIEYLEELKKLNESAGNDVTQIDRDIAALRLQISEQLTSERTENELAANQAIQDSAQALFDASVELANQIYEQKIAEDEAEIQRIDERLQAETQLAGDNEARKAQLEEDAQKRKDELQKKVNKEKQKQAKLNKVLSIVEIAINTAKGISNALGSFPPPASFVLAAITAALGAVQIAAVASQKIPSFAKGTDNAPRGLAEINEEGAEIVEDRRGNKKIFNQGKRSLVYLEGGEKITPAKESAQELERLEQNGSFNNNTKVFEDGTQQIKAVAEQLAAKQINEVLNTRFDGLERTIKNKQETHWIIQNGELQKWVRTGENWNRIVNESYG